MDLRKKLLDLSRQATGDPEVFVAGDFQPKGLTWKRAAGALAGSAIGDAAGGGNDLAQALGSGVGYAAGTLAGTSGDLPPVIVAAASPTKLYLLTTNNAKGMVLAHSLVLLTTLDRANLLVETKQRVTTRTVVITDESSGQEFKMEGQRILLHHMNALLDAIADHHGEDVHDDGDEELAGVAHEPART